MKGIVDRDLGLQYLVHFNYCKRTNKDMDKQIVSLASVHQISWDIILNWILTAFGRCCSGEDVCCNILGGVF